MMKRMTIEDLKHYDQTGDYPVGWTAANFRTTITALAFAAIKLEDRLAHVAEEKDTEICHAPFSEGRWTATHRYCDTCGAMALYGENIQCQFQRTGGPERP